MGDLSLIWQKFVCYEYFDAAKDRITIVVWKVVA